MDSIPNTIIGEGNTTTITYKAIGFPPPTIMWSRANEILTDRLSVSDSVSVPTGYGNVTRVSANLQMLLEKVQEYTHMHVQLIIVLAVIALMSPLLFYTQTSLHF